MLSVINVRLHMIYKLASIKLTQLVELFAWQKKAAWQKDNAITCDKNLPGLCDDFEQKMMV